jgi:hypothetical protein
VKLKVGLDIHGVCDENKEFFMEFTKMLVNAGHEVHLLTGPSKIKAEREAIKLGLSYTHFFSITDFYVNSGEYVVFDENGDPHMDEYLWDRAKADYCLREGIQLHLDDSDSYGYFFKTPYCRYYSKNKRKHYVKA